MITNRMVVVAAWELLVEQYQAGATVSELAKRHDMKRATLTDRLKRRGVFIEGRKNGLAQKTVCAGGHDQNKFRKNIIKTHPDGREVKNGSYCMECKRLREMARRHAS